MEERGVFDFNLNKIEKLCILNYQQESRMVTFQHPIFLNTLSTDLRKDPSVNKLSK